MGILCNFLNDIQTDYKKVLKLFWFIWT
jgi:hypothetical protein